MRLICPNCGAQYEVADDVIPTAGRDVQCSNCGHTWFEMPGGSEAAEADIDLAIPVDEPRQAEAAQVQSADNQDRSNAPGANVWDDDEADDADDYDDAEDENDQFDATKEDEPPVDAPKDITDTAKAMPPDDDMEAHAAKADDDTDPDTDDAIAEVAGASPQRREIAPEVAEILREEAAREDQQRRANIRATIESQPDLGIDSSADPDAQRNEESRRRMARMRGESAPPVGADMSGSRRDLLPDIEEINSTLRATTQRAEMADAAPPAEYERRRGFRFGFSSMVVIALIAGAIYITAPKIIAAVPATESVLTAYVNGINEARLWLDLKMQQILEQMNPPADAGTN